MFKYTYLGNKHSHVFENNVLEILRREKDENPNKLSNKKTKQKSLIYDINKLTKNIENFKK